MVSIQDNAKLVETSFLIIREKQESFAPLFYEKLFKYSPQLRPMFRKTNMEQQHKKLYESLVLLVENIRDAAFLKKVLSALGEKHIGYGVIASHYPLVGKALISALKETAGDEWSPKVEQAWSETYSVVVELMLSSTNTVVNDTEELEDHLGELQKQQQKKFRPSKKLTYAQKRALQKNKTLVSRIIDWFWAKPNWVIAAYATLLFTLFSFIGQENTYVSFVVGILEPLSIILAVLFYVKEYPERKKQFQYQAWSVLDRATRIESSRARVLALEELCDEGVSLSEVNLEKANLNEIELNGVDLSMAHLNQAQLVKAELFYANFTNADLSESNCTEMVCYRSDLGFVNFQKANCSSANFRKANLMFVNFNEANLNGCDFSHANLKGASFDGATINGANFKGAKIILEDLKKGQLSEVILPDGQMWG